MPTQLGLFGRDYKVSPSCDGCECIVASTDRFDTPDGEKLCATCVEENDLVGCENCRDAVEECAENPDGDNWCYDCLSEVYIECEHCNKLAEETTTVCTSSYPRISEEWCEDCADRHATHCDDCGEYASDTYTTAGDADICASCYENNYFTCDNCCEIFHSDNYYRGNDSGGYCEDCCPNEGDYEPSGFRSRGSLTEMGSARRYGIELETDECSNYYDLEGSAWGAKNDPTVNGKEFFSDILEGDDGLQAIRDWARLAERHDWRAGYSAGFHLHLDLRDESDDSMYAIAYAYCATQALWLSFVESRRRDTTYAMALRYNCHDIEQGAATGTYSNWASIYDRYNWANVGAYGRHHTIEIRLHQGTCDGDEVCNWVKAHTRFADWAATKGLAGVKEALDGCDDMFKLVSCEAWQDAELSEYYAGKAASYR